MSKSKNEQIGAVTLRELLAYDEITGVLIWKESPSRNVKAGDIAGHKSSRGYIHIKVLGSAYLAHRLAWLHSRGEWPLGQIDHIDGNKTNNAIANLRDVSQSVNMQNRRTASINSSSGLLGVSRKGDRWEARIRTNGARRYIGSYATPEMAHAAYLAAKRVWHPGNML